MIQLNQLNHNICVVVKGNGKNLKQKKRGLIPKAFGTAAAIVGKHPKCGAEVLPHGVFNPRGVRSKRKADDVSAH